MPERRIKEIEMRLSAIKAELSTENADITALTKETDDLLEERTTLMNQVEQRKRTLAKVSQMEGEPVMPHNEPEKRSFGVDSVEYRSAWLKQIRGLELNEVEKRALTTATGSAGAAVPTSTANKIIEKAKQYAPLLEEIDLYEVAGNLTIPAEGTTTDAAVHEEGKTITAGEDTLGKVELSAYEVTKLLTISKSVETMSIEAFERWLVDKLGRKVAEKITFLILYGTGTKQAQGINAITWNAKNSVTVAAGASLTEANILTVVGLLNGGYDAGAKWRMSKKTFLTDFYPLMNKSKNVTIDRMDGKWYVQGYEVQFEDRVTEHEAFLGNMRLGYAGNMPEQVNVTKQFVARENAYDFLGAAMFDGRVQAIEAFVKIAKATT